MGEWSGEPVPERWCWRPTERAQKLWRAQRSEQGAFWECRNWRRAETLVDRGSAEELHHTSTFQRPLELLVPTAFPPDSRGL